MVSDLLLRGTLFGGRGGDNNNGNAIVLVIGVVLMILTPIIATVMRFAISRKRELLADATGAMLTRYPEGLARALEKIHGYGSKMKSANRTPIKTAKSPRVALAFAEICSNWLGSPDKNISSRTRSTF